MVTEQSTFKKLVNQSTQIFDAVKEGVDWASGKTRIFQKKTSLMVHLIKLKRQETRLLVKLGQRIYGLFTEEEAESQLLESLSRQPVISKLISDLKQINNEIQEVKKTQDKL